MLKIRNLVFILIIFSIVIMGFRQLNDKKYLLSNDVLRRCCNNALCYNEPCSALASVSLVDVCQDFNIDCYECMDYRDCTAKGDTTYSICDHVEVGQQKCWTYINGNDTTWYYGNCDNLFPR